MERYPVDLSLLGWRVQSKSDFRADLLVAFPLVEIEEEQLLAKANGFLEAETIRDVLARATWNELSFEECFRLHDCLWMLTSSAVKAFLPALLLSCYPPPEGDVLFQSLCSWLGTEYLSDCREFFGDLSEEQSASVVKWLGLAMAAQDDEAIRARIQRSLATCWGTR